MACGAHPLVWTLPRPGKKFPVRCIHPSGPCIQLPMDHLSDVDLVAAAQAGDTASFGELVRRQAPRLLALAGQLVGPDAAEDVVQDG